MWSLLQKRCDHTLNKLNDPCCNCYCNGEYSSKYIDTSYSPLLDNTGFTGLLNDPAQGTDVNQRVGLQFANIRLLARFWITIPKPTPNLQLARVIIFWDNGYNQSLAPPDKNDILEGGVILAPYNWNNQERFQILYDKTFTLGLMYYSGSVGPNTTIMTMNPIQHFEDIVLDLGNRITTIASSGAVKLVTGQLQVLTFGTNTSGVGVATLQWYSRVIFTDK